MKGIGAPGGNQEPDEIKELEAKLDAMTIPDEAKKIYKAEIKKVKQLGPRN